MKYQSTNTWSYHIVSKRQLNFYHVLLSKVELREIMDNTTYVSKVKKERDGSVTVTLREDGHLQETIAELSSFFNDVEADFVETPYTVSKLPTHDRSVLKEWYFSIMGAVALTLVHDPLIKDVCTGKWEFIDSTVNTVYVEPYTILFTSDYVKIMHPIRPQNYALREHIERVAATAFTKIFTRISEAYPGCEGLAILSYTQEKTNLSPEAITSLIHLKSQSLSTRTVFI